MNISAENIKLIFGLKVKELRHEHNFSLAKLSDITGISKSYLNEIEKGKKYPKPEKITWLARALDTTYEQLVSPHLSKRLAPISDLIQSNVLNELPLDFFGIEPIDLLALLSEAPTRFSAFVDAVIQIGRDHDLRVESLYFSVLRSYQEMYDNYFPELERLAKQCRKNMGIDPRNNNITEELIEELTKTYRYSIEFDGFKNHPDLESVLYLLIPGHSPRLLINKAINRSQLLLLLARQLGLNILNIKDLPYTSSWVETRSFDHVLNNFRSFYFASALLLDERIFTKGLVDFTKRTTFNPNEVIDLMESNNSSPEMYMLRITNLVPHYFRFPQLFFVRYNHHLANDRIVLNKALHGSGLDKSSRLNLGERACQRWAADRSLKLLKSTQQRGQYIRPICTIYQVQYSESSLPYLIISVSGSVADGSELNYCISVGFLVNKRFQARINFSEDSAISSHVVDMDWLAKNENRFEDSLGSISNIQRENELKVLRKKIHRLIDNL